MTDTDITFCDSIMKMDTSKIKYKFANSEDFNSISRDDVDKFDSTDSTDSTDNNISVNKYNIYRYKFDENVMNELSIFSKTHSYDDKDTFKESWDKWVSENLSMIQREEARLLDLGYKGCVKTKMYKSCRYYFSKKQNDKEKKDRRNKYLMVNPNILSSMDKHIIQNINKDDYKPSNGYEEYCVSNIDLLKEDVIEMVGLNMNLEEIKLKIKKTYKNRYFIISRNINKYKQIYENSSSDETN